MRCKHQHLCLKYGSISERQVNSHLVTVEVGVECGTYERVQLDGLSFDKFRLEGLDAQSVKSGGTVKHYRVSLENVLEDIPYHRVLAINNFLG